VVDQDELYAVLLAWALGPTIKNIGSYTDLSKDYQQRTGVWIDPRTGWDEPLGQLNRHLHTRGAPPLSALVINHQLNEPGARFWGSAPNVPPKPPVLQQRQGIWALLVKQVLAYPWPPTRP
jgi:hypothetical protein